MPRNAKTHPITEAIIAEMRSKREMQEINSQITGSLNEGITDAKTIKSPAIEE